MKKLFFTIIFFVGLGLAVGATLPTDVAHAAFNNQINYQGRLTTPSGVAVTNGNYNVQFNLYTVPTGGASIWTETDCFSTNNGTTCTGSGTDQRVTITNGLFSVMLGSTTPFTNVNFNQTLYLGVNIGGTGSTPSYDGEMTPRKILGAVPAAMFAGTSTVALTLNGVSDKQFIRNDQQNSTSSASTFLNILQTGAGKIAEFFGAASQSVFALLSNGNVGIGSSTPGSLLSVEGSTTNATTTLFTVASSSGASFLTVLPSGNVGVGSSTPGALFSVGGNSLFGGNLTATGALTVNGQTNLASSLNGILFATNGVVGTTSSSSLGIFNYFTNSSATTSLTTGSILTALTGTFGTVNATNTSATNYFGGNVGIGTTAPAQALDVNGNIRVSGNTSYIDFNGTRTITASTTLQNFYFGGSSGNTTATGQYNTGFGQNALNALSTGQFNTAIGRYSLPVNTSGSNNTAIGNGALFDATSSNDNTAIGNGSMPSFIGAAGGGNTVIGSASMHSTTLGLSNTCIGFNCLYNLTTGSNNTAVGRNAGFNLLGASGNNVFLGQAAGFNQTAGSGNIVIGYSVDVASTTGSNQLNIGNFIYGSSNGNVGIGTTTPATALSVIGTTTTQGLNISNLASTFLAVDPSGNVIATTSAGGVNYFTNSSATTSLTTGSILTALTGTFGTINATSTTGTSTFANAATFGGNVGIGSSTPNSLLSIQGTSGSTTPLFTVASSTGSTTFTVLANGNVGIGTASPSSKLYVQSGVITSYDPTGSGNGFVTYLPTNGVATALVAGLNNSAFLYSTGFSIQSTALSNVLAGIAPGGTSIKMFVTNGGNVGIGSGITSPNALQENVGTTEQLRLSYDQTHYTSFTTASTGSLNIGGTTGKVGIGTSTPATALSVIGTTTTQGLNISNLASTFLAVDPSGNVIATTSAGGVNYFTNSSATTSLTTGSILTALTGTFGTINATSTTGTSTFANAATFGGNVGIGSTSPFAALSVNAANGSGSGNGTDGLAVYGGTGGYSGSTFGSGGGITLVGGDTGSGAGGAGLATGGTVVIRSGNGGANGGSGGNGNHGGSLILSSGNGSNGVNSGGGGGNGGSISFTAGNAGTGGGSATAGTAGSLTFTAGSGASAGTSTPGGNITLNPGAIGSGSAAGNILLASSSGKVGIGTSTPGSLLSVAGTAQITATSTLTGIKLTNLSSTVLAVDANGNVIATTSSGGPNFFSNSSASTTLTTGSNLLAGIGTFGTIIATSTGTSTFAGNISISGATQLASNLNGLLWATNGLVGTTSTSSLGFTFGNSAWTIGNQTIYNATSTDRISIGTSTPYSKFFVLGTYGSTTPIFTIASTTSTAGATSSLLTVLSNGNVGIGSSTPFSALEAVGNGLFTGSFSANNLIAASTTATSTISGGLVVGNGGLTYDLSSTATSIQNLQMGNMSFDMDAGQVSWVDLPITTASATGTIESYSANLNGNPVLTIFGTADGQGNILTPSVNIGSSTAPNATLTVWATSTEPGFSVLSYASSSLFTVLNSGFVGIGTSTPGSALDVGGNVTDESVKGCNGGSGGLGTTASGTVYCEVSFSDQRLKTNITDLDAADSLNLINSLNPVSFYWKDPSIPGTNSMQEQFGFIAQQVDKFAPNLVGTTTSTYLTPDQTYYLNYQGIIAPLVKAVQAQQGEIMTTSSSTVQASTTLASLSAQLQAYSLALANATTTLSAQVSALTLSTAQLTASLASTSADIASSTAATLSTSDSFIQTIANAVIAMLQSSGQAINSAGSWVVNKMSASIVISNDVQTQTLETQSLTTQTASISDGLQMTDQATGYMYCVRLVEGEFAKVLGTCSSTASSTPTMMTVPDAPSTAPVTTPTPPPSAPVSTIDSGSDSTTTSIMASSTVSDVSSVTTAPAASSTPTSSTTPSITTPVISSSSPIVTASSSPTVAPTPTLSNPTSGNDSVASSTDDSGGN